MLTSDGLKLAGQSSMEGMTISSITHSEAPSGENNAEVTTNLQVNLRINHAFEHLPLDSHSNKASIRGSVGSIAQQTATRQLAAQATVKILAQDWWPVVAGGDDDVRMCFLVFSSDFPSTIR